MLIRRIFLTYKRLIPSLILMLINHSMSSCYRRHEGEKRRVYEERVREIGHGTFTPLVFSSSGGMGPAARTFHERLAPKIADRRASNYSHTRNWDHSHLGFSILCSSIMCLKGARSSYHRPVNFNSLAIDLVVFKPKID